MKNSSLLEAEEQCPVHSWCAMDEMEGKMKANNNLESKNGESWGIQQTQSKARVGWERYLIEMLWADLLCRKLGMYFCSQWNINNGMHTDVIELFQKYVNTHYEHQSSEEFAQLSSVGMETEGWEAANVPSAFSVDPHNTGIWKKNRAN